MSRKLLMRALVPPLNQAHLIDLLQGYEDSGFFAGDPLTARNNELAIRRSGNPFGPNDVFLEGPLAGRVIRDQPLRFQTYGLAPTIEVLPRARRRMSEAFAGLIGKPLTISSTLRRAILEEYYRLELKTDDIDSFLCLQHGLPAAIGSE